MKIFDYARKHPQEILAVTDEGEEILYGELNKLSIELGKIVGHRLVFVLCRNTPGSLLGYLGLLESGGVPLLLDADIAPELLEGLVQTYRPAFCLFPEDLPRESRQVCLLQSEAMRIRDYRLVRSVQQKDRQETAPAPELRLLLTTSGSTGSRKLVRISGENLDTNTASIIEYLKITREDRPITVLPMQYSYGMSIINTHVMAGAKILLTRHTLMEKRFWERVREEKCTSLCGVPYTFDMYNRLGLTKMDLPCLRTVTQAGGKLSEKRHMQFARWAAEKGIRFYVMYGQTEASPRMGWLPPEKAIEKCGSMGIAIPGGTISLIDENGNVIPESAAATASQRAESCSPDPDTADPDTADPETADSDTAESAAAEQKAGDLSPVGELVYTGPNVALGYAVCAEDLAKGDEFHGILHTGDMARRDRDGYFYIVGRQSRFIKIAGKRIGLDEVEKILRTAFPDLDLACAGKDEDLHVFVTAAGGNPAENGIENSGKSGGEDKGEKAFHERKEKICSCIQDMTGISERRISVFPISEIPRNSSGKIQYSVLNNL